MSRWQSLGQKPHWLKWQRRAGLVITNSFNSLLPMLFAPIVSLLVIRQTSAALWGTFVGVLITVQLGVHIAAWGNSEYLLREFSRNPAQIASAWQSSFQSRLILVLGLGVTVILLYPDSAVWAVLWGTMLVLHQSCAVLITYKRDFVFATGVELTGLILTIAAVLHWGSDITPFLLIQLFALVTSLKATLLLLRYREMMKGWHGHFEKQYFVWAFPFFLLGFSGMLNSRIDLYAVHAFLTPEDVGNYQVFSSFLLYVQALAAFILTPFIKSLYRLHYAAIGKISFSLFGVGWLIVPPAMVSLFFLLSRLYGIYLAPSFFVVGGLAILPIFYFLPIIYALYKAEKQTAVLKVNLFSIFLTLLLNLLFLPLWGLVGAIISMAIVKWLVLLIYTWQRKTFLK